MPMYRAWLRSTNRSAVLTREELQHHLRRKNIVQVKEIGEKQPINNPPAPKPTESVSGKGTATPRQRNGVYRQERTKEGGRG